MVVVPGLAPVLTASSLLLLARDRPVARGPQQAGFDQAGQRAQEPTGLLLAFSGPDLQLSAAMPDKRKPQDGAEQAAAAKRARISSNGQASTNLANGQATGAQKPALPAREAIEKAKKAMQERKALLERQKQLLQSKLRAAGVAVSFLAFMPPHASVFASLCNSVGCKHLKWIMQRQACKALHCVLHLPLWYSPADTLAPLLTQPLLLRNRARLVQQQPRQQLLRQLQQVCVPRHPCQGPRLQAWGPQEWLALPQDRPLA